MKKCIALVVIILIFCSCSAHKEPMLVGEADLQRVVSFEPGFKDKVALYEPSPQAIAFLHSYDKKVLIEVIYGSWCVDSVLNVPRFIKVIQEANNPHIITRFVGVDRSKKKPASLLLGKGIQRVPTFIVYQEEKELGRIVENPFKSIEEDLVQILKKD